METWGSREAEGRKNPNLTPEPFHSKASAFLCGFQPRAVRQLRNFRPILLSRRLLSEACRAFRQSIKHVCVPFSPAEDSHRHTRSQTQRAEGEPDCRATSGQGNAGSSPRNASCKGQLFDGLVCLPESFILTMFCFSWRRLGSKLEVPLCKSGLLLHSSAEIRWCGCTLHPHYAHFTPM